MSVSKEIMEKAEAEAEAQAVLDKAYEEREALAKKYWDQGVRALDGHNDEHKEIMKKALEEVNEIRKKYGIEPAPKE